MDSVNIFVTHVVITFKDGSPAKWASIMFKANHNLVKDDKLIEYRASDHVDDLKNDKICDAYYIEKFGEPFYKYYCEVVSSVLASKSGLDMKNVMVIGIVNIEEYEDGYEPILMRLDNIPIEHSTVQ